METLRANMFQIAARKGSVRTAKLIVNLFEQMNRFVVRSLANKRKERDMQVMQKLQTGKIYAQLAGTSKRDDMIAKGLLVPKQG